MPDMDNTDDLGAVSDVCKSKACTGLSADLEVLWRLSKELLFAIQSGAGDGDPERHALALRDSIKVLVTAENDLLANETHGCYKGNS